MRFHELVRQREEERGTVGRLAFHPAGIVLGAQQRQRGGAVERLLPFRQIHVSRRGVVHFLGHVHEDAADSVHQMRDALGVRPGEVRHVHAGEAGHRLHERRIAAQSGHVVQGMRRAVRKLHLQVRRQGDDGGRASALVHPHEQVGVSLRPRLALGGAQARRSGD